MPVLARAPRLYSSDKRAIMKVQHLPCDRLGAVKLHDVTGTKR